jgi:hypothetical protein
VTISRVSVGCWMFWIVESSCRRDDVWICGSNRASEDRRLKSGGLYRLNDSRQLRRNLVGGVDWWSSRPPLVDRRIHIIKSNATGATVRVCKNLRSDVRTRMVGDCAYWITGKICMVLIAPSACKIVVSMRMIEDDAY